MGYRKHEYMTVVMAGVLFAAASLSSSAVMPEFGNAVQFDNNGPFPVLSRLRGKAVLIIFFQSWCPKCNVWAPTLIKQVQEGHGNDRSVVTMAIKTDGGGLSGALRYLSGIGADLSKWRVGSDANATYYKYVTGGNALWNYVLVGPDGTIVEKAYCGSFYGASPQAGKFTIADKRILKGCGKLKTVLPAEKRYPPSLKPIVDLAEMRYLSKALSLATSAARRTRDREAAKGLKKDILTIVETAIRKQMDVLKDETQDWGSRYEAHKELALIMKGFRTVPSAKEANALLGKTRRDPALVKEKYAEAAYARVARKLRRASARYRQLLAKELDAVAKRHAGTKYGKLAAEQAAKIRGE